ncbi:serine hydrolase [Puniceibacterium sp. IMCC21224]|uniref:serine hydrolase domain-containing protein n=1 Tax=Puniceibacterium sp. IMCC21224 TaxID=1618204 RepID=UPI00065D686C|nr:serine hydrolase domain-containing protein [Puniceibacterium sp. IMCC21224]KMK67408.1 Beta-lactamase [Puniceibacterium sp. IMCC21224]
MRMPHLTSFVTASTLLLAVPAEAQDNRGAELARVLLQRSGAPGVAVAWIDEGRRGIAVAGVRARGTDVAISPQDQWHIGSNAKSMTATLVARLVEADVIHWDDTIAQHLQGFPIDPGYRDVTLAQLLAHRGGLPTNPGRWFLHRLTGHDVMADRRAYAAQILGHTPQPQPGRSFHYSNAGYVVVGAMLEAATGQSWEVLMQDWLFEPLDMESAGFGAPGTAQTLSQPRGHGGHFPWSRAVITPGPEADNVAAMGPAGTVHLSLNDHLRYLRAHMTRPKSFLSDANWNRLQSDVAGQGYAMGWVVRSDRILAHTGSNTFWYNMVFVDRAGRRVLTLAMNEAALARVEPAAAGVAQLFFAQDGATATETPDTQ